MPRNGISRMLKRIVPEGVRRKVSRARTTPWGHLIHDPLPGQSAEKAPVVGMLQVQAKQGTTPPR